MMASRYTLKQRPGALIEASRDMKKNKRSVMKAIGMPLKKKKAKKGSDSLVKSPSARYMHKTAKEQMMKGSMRLVKSPKSHSTLRTKKVGRSSGKSFGDESIQGAKMERRGEGSKHFKTLKKKHA